ncbi:unnamed protein product, partial [Rangifer tarandus platyrhynchus]
LVSEPTKKTVKAEPIAVCKYAPRRGRGARRGQEKEDSHLSFSNKDPCASLHEGSLSRDCRQGRTGSSDGNPRTSNPDMVSKPKSSAPPAERKGAWQCPGPRTRRRIGHDRSCSRGPKGPTRCPQHLSSPWPLSDTGEHATLGCSRSFGRPHLLGARDCLWGLCGQPLMFFVIQPSPMSLQPSEKPPPRPQVAVPWAACSPADTAPWQPGPGAILPPLQPETHIRQRPESPVGEGTAPLLEPQPHPPSLPRSTSLLDELLAATGILETQAPSAGDAADARVHPALPGEPSILEEFVEATGIPDMQAPCPGAAADARVHPALPDAPSFLDELLEAMGITDWQAPSPGAAADAGAHPALPGTASILEEFVEATGIPDTQAPSPGAAADSEVHPALPDAPSFLDELLEATGIADWQAPSPGAAADAGAHPALPVATSFLDELLDATGIEDSQAPSPEPGADAGVHPALPDPPSFLDELLEATGLGSSQAPSPGAAADAGAHPALPGTPSFLGQLLEATDIAASQAPSLGPYADAGAHLALPGSPSLQDELLAVTCIPGSPGPSLGSSPVIPGYHPALPGSPSLLEEIMAASSIQDTPWSSPRAAADEEGVEAILEAPLREEDYQALLDMLPGSPGPRA